MYLLKYLPLESCVFGSLSTTITNVFVASQLIYYLQQLTGSRPVAANRERLTGSSLENMEIDK